MSSHYESKADKPRSPRMLAGGTLIVAAVYATVIERWFGVKSSNVSL